jgi:phenylacetic acid degradation operon negative regulatory protein
MSIIPHPVSDPDHRSGRGLRQTCDVRARSALFDVYGDHLRSRGSQAPVSGLVRLLNPVGIQAPAVRTAISRMVMQDWLEPVLLAGARGYRATPRAIRRLDEAADRIYRRHDLTWDHHWHLAFVDPPPERGARARLRADLSFLGYAEIGESAWISPHPRADHVDPPPTTAWDLDALRAAYDRWLAEADDLIAVHTSAHDDPDEAAFAARFHLVHEWRKFLFADPGLPEELLPRGWPGRAAADLFASEANRLKPGADRFVSRCLDPA